MARSKPALVLMTKEELRERRWAPYLNCKWEGKPSGNAIHAMECYNTPLEAKPILDLLAKNLYYFGDSYYDALTTPVSMRVDEYYESLGEKVPNEY